MNLKTTFKIATKGLKMQRSRSVLTILGIVIGITAIMMVMSLGKGAQDLILGQIQSMGAKTIAVHPGKKPEGVSSFAQMFSDSLKQKDLDALSRKENVPYAGKIEPLNVGAAVASFGNQTYSLSIFGSSNLMSDIYALTVSDGRFIDQEDVKEKASVTVIGSKVKEELFGQDQAVGQKIRIKGVNFKVVGVLAKKGQSFINFDEAAIMPWTTEQTYISGNKFFNHIIIESTSESLVDQTVNDVTLTLRNSHNITDATKDDFYVVTQASAIQQVSAITSILTLFLAAVAAISLLVGGVGIMNIMLVSVTERTREIGLRKALGATSKDIMSQFLIEAVLLTSIGGVIGIAMGTLLSLATAVLLSKVAGLQWIFAFPLSAAFLGLGVSVIIGMIFGIYPAKQAAKKSPIEALRYE